MKVARRHAVALHGVDEGGENGDTVRFAVLRRIGALREGVVESGAPSGKSALLIGDLVAFIGYVIDQAHEGVESGERVALWFRQEEKRVIKIAVSGFDDALALLVGIRQRIDGDGILQVFRFAIG